MPSHGTTLPDLAPHAPPGNRSHVKQSHLAAEVELGDGCFCCRHHAPVSRRHVWDQERKGCGGNRHCGLHYVYKINATETGAPASCYTCFSDALLGNPGTWDSFSWLWCCTSGIHVQAVVVLLQPGENFPHTP